MTDKRLQEILSKITVIVDTREQENSHIIDYFESKHIIYRKQKLDFGDYSVLIRPCPEYGINEEATFFSKIAIERKNSLEEISSCVSKDRDRFERELVRSEGSRFILMVEESQGYEKIINHKYNTELSEKSFIATLFSYGHRYNVDINFIEKKYAGLFIYWQLFYFCRERMKEFLGVTV